MLAVYTDNFYYHYGHRLAGAYDHHEPLAPGDRGVEEVSLQEGEILGEKAEDHGWKLAALRLVHGHGIRQGQGIQVRALVLHLTSVEVYDDSPVSRSAAAIRPMSPLNTSR
jgi:hypothetical protein